MTKNPLLFASAGVAIFALAGAFYFLTSTPKLNSTVSLGDARTAAALSQKEDAARREEMKNALPDLEAEHAHGVPHRPKHELEIRDLMTADLPDLDKAKQMLGRLPSLSPDAQVFAMQQATQLIPDEQYVQMRPWLYQLSRSSELRETVLIDVLSRSEKVRMPTLVDMLRQPPNEAQAEVREILLAYLDKDPGSDIAQWEAAVQKFLIENDEE